MKLNLSKRFFVMGIFVIFVALLVAGCSSSKTESNSGNTSNNSQQQQASANPTNFTIVGGSVGGAWSVYTEGVSELLRQSIKDVNFSAEPGSTSGNPGVVSDGRAQGGLATTLVATKAFKGEAPFDKKLTNLRAIAALIPNHPFQVMATKKSGISSFDDIKNKNYPLKISVDSQGSAGDMVTKAVLEGYGITYDQLEKNGGKVYYLPGSKTFEMMGDGRMDGMGDVMPAPSGDVLEAATSIDLTLLDINPEVVKSVGDKTGGYSGIIKKENYDFLDHDVQSISYPVILLVTDSLSDDLAYQMAKTIYENVDYLQNVASGFEITKDNVVNVGGVPLHPGAEKYFKEIGAIK